MEFKATEIQVFKAIGKNVLQIVVDNSLELNDLSGLKTPLSVIIKPFVKKRSLDANAYFHLLVGKIAKVLNTSEDEIKINLNLEYGAVLTDRNGNEIIVKLSKDIDIKNIYKYAKFLKDKQEKNIVTSYYLLYKNTSDLDSKEMARLIEGVIYEARELGIETITPEEKQRMLERWS